MPNWIDNTLTVDKDIDQVKAYCGSDESPLDFQKILPCPDELLSTTSCLNNEIGYDAFFSDGEEWKEIAQYPWVIEAGITAECGRETFMRQFNDAFPHFHEPGAQAAGMIKKYGSMDWYHWCVKHWGTKWNACNVSEIEHGFTFETAWDPPWGIIEELTRVFPDVTFTVISWEEIPCDGCWRVVARDREIIEGSQRSQDPCPICREQNGGKCWQDERNPLEDEESDPPKVVS